ncbi:unnamed protein product, partial [Didymodactylos carnosus]
RNNLGLASSSPTSQKECEVADGLFETIKSVKDATACHYTKETTLDVDDDPLDYSSGSEEEEGESEEEAHGRSPTMGTGRSIQEMTLVCPSVHVFIFAPSSSISLQYQETKMSGYS